MFGQTNKVNYKLQVKKKTHPPPRRWGGIRLEKSHDPRQWEKIRFMQNMSDESKRRSVRLRCWTSGKTSPWETGGWGQGPVALNAN